MKRLLLVVASAAALWSTACGGGGGTTILPPPTGQFGLSSLNGTYAFFTSGEVASSTSTTNLARTGSFVANGTGGITSGVEDVAEPGVLPSLAVLITGGSYTVDGNGRGSLTLNVSAGGVPSTISFGIVLTSTSGGLLIDETSTTTQASTGSGNFFKQNSAAFTNPILPVQATYVFDFSGLDGGLNGESLVGEFTAASGAISGGFEDANDNFSLTNGAIPPGTLSPDPANPATLTSFGRGVATIAGEDYVFYIVDATRIRFLSTSGGAMLSGDAVIQTSAPASLSNGFVFVVAGTSATGGGITRIGRFTASGAAVNSVLVDTNNVGVFTSTNSATNGSVALDPANPGRGTVTFKDPNLSLPFTFVFYLTSATNGVIQDITQSSVNGPTDVADGTIAGQTGNPFSSTNITGTYAMNWTGLSLQSGVADEEDLVGQTTVSSLALTGAADIFQFQNLNGPQTGNALTGTITVGGDGAGDDGKRSTMAVTLTKNGQTTTVDFVVYFASPQLAFFANTSTSSTRIVDGVLETQQ